SFFFFFQAEDGIRDLTVTGVQTCALPICLFCLFQRRYGKDGDTIQIGDGESETLLKLLLDDRPKFAAQCFESLCVQEFTADARKEEGVAGNEFAERSSADGHGHRRELRDALLARIDRLRKPCVDGRRRISLHPRVARV